MKGWKSILRATVKTSLIVFAVLIANVHSLLVAGVGVFWIYDGLNRGAMFYPLTKEAPVGMTVVKVDNRNHRRYLPDYVATGFVRGNPSMIDVPIFKKEFRELHPGGSLDVYPLASGKWMDRATLDESWPIFNLFGLHFSWHLPAGILMLLAWFWLVPSLRRIQNQPKGKERAVS